MNRPSRLLVTFDGSDPSRSVFSHAASLATAMNAGLTLLEVHAVPTHIWAIPDPEQRQQAIQAHARDRVDEVARVAEEIRQSYGVEVEAISRPLNQRWSVADEILAVADEIDAAVICMATQGQSSQSHFIIGSTTISVLAKSKRPLVVVRSDAGSGG